MPSQIISFPITSSQASAFVFSFYEMASVHTRVKFLSLTPASSGQCSTCWVTLELKTPAFPCPSLLFYQLGFYAATYYPAK